MLRSVALPLAAFFGITLSVAPLSSQPSRESAAQPPRGRPLAIEDYYAIRTVAAPRISDDGRTVTYTVSTRIESDNSTKSERWRVATDGSSEPQRIGGDEVPVPGPGRGGGRGAPIASPDGKWMATTRDKAQPKAEPTYASDFEKRHQERFKGAIFDWKDFQRDGQPFPAPNQRALPASQIVITPAGGGDARALTDADLRPTGLAWAPDGSRLLFIADPDWRDELKYESPDLWLVTTTGAVTRLTNNVKRRT
jgi:Tol biopolymer transport system component